MTFFCFFLQTRDTCPSRQWSTIKSVLRNITLDILALLCRFLQLCHFVIEVYSADIVYLYRMIRLYKSTGTSHPSRRWWDMSASQLGAQLRRQRFNAPKRGPDPNGSMMICECYHISLIGYICAYMPLYAVICYYVQYSSNSWERSLYI